MSSESTSRNTFRGASEKGPLPVISQCHSPNHDPRPNDTAIDLLVIHCISLPPKQYGGPWINDLFLNRLDPTAHPYFKNIAALKVSAHFLINRGGQITQYIPVRQRAWHAGVSCFKDRENCNDYSIGIELEGWDAGCFTPKQYDSLRNLTQQIMEQYPAITHQRIVGHSDIAPDRKADPGTGFDWSRYLDSLRIV